jgi:hypothetical protein
MNAMVITSKSLLQANLVFALEQTDFSSPSNEDFNSIFHGKDASGSRFIDDPVMQVKILNLPNLKTKIILEQGNLRTDDDSGVEPKESLLIGQALKAFRHLFPKGKIDGFGFNFDLVFRFNNVIAMKEIFKNIVNEETLAAQELINLGVQFTTSEAGGKIINTYFLKIVSPLELAVHYNRHFFKKDIPGEAELQSLFEKKYNDLDKIIESLKF